MRIGALNTRMSEMELIVIVSEVETIGRVDGRSIWKLCASSTLVLAGPERMDSIPEGGERGMEVDLEDLEDWHGFSELEGRDKEKKKDITKRVLSTAAFTTRLE
jgi:hypothetical protein